MAEANPPPVDYQWYEEHPVRPLYFTPDIVLLATVVIATSYHYLGLKADSPRPLGVQLLLTFSLRRNIAQLVQTPKHSSQITCLFGLRLIGMLWVAVAHTFKYARAFVTNLEEYSDDLVDNFFNQWLSSSSLSSDMFFIIGGCLLSYTWFRKWQRKCYEPEPTWTSFGYWLRFYWHRVVRLWPTYMYILVAVTTRIRITDYNDWWARVDPAVQCPSQWWKNALFINSLIGHRCMGWTWYIGTEFVFYFISPIYLLALRRNFRVGLALICATMLASSMFNVGMMIAYGFPPAYMNWKRPPIFSTDMPTYINLVFVKPWARVNTYMVGLLLGYHLANYSLTAHHETDTTKHFSLPHSCRFIACGWALAAMTGFYSIFGFYPSLHGWDWPLYHLVYGSTFTTAFALSMAWVIYVCHTNLGGPLNWVLSLPPLLTLSKLTYPFYLVHMVPVAHTLIHAPQPMVYTSKWQIIGYSANAISVSFCLGALFTLMVELPCLNLERILLTPATVTTRSRQKNKGAPSVGDSSETTALIMEHPTLKS